MVMIRDIQRKVAALYGLPDEVMCEKDGPFGSRERKYCRPRHVAMYLSRQLCSHGTQREHGRASLEMIGRHFGGRDHTTILHGCHMIEKFMLSDTEERRAVGEICLQIIEGDR